MSLERKELLKARLGDRLWLTDAGIETVLIFHDGLDLPSFASFPLLQQEEGRAAMARYFNDLLDEARRQGSGFVLDTATWRASAGWAPDLGLTPQAIDDANREAVRFAAGLRAARPDQPILLNGTIGPHGDAYAPDRVLSPDEAQDYHARQIAVLDAAGVDMISALTLSSTGEAIGIGRAARQAGCPVVLSFTVETDGRLISGKTLAEAIAETDAATDGFALWYGINCAHPEHFRAVLQGDWVSRIGTLRANASPRSHAELDEATELDAGDPDTLAAAYRDLLDLMPGLRVLGGCCGTDLRHVAAIGQACLHHRPSGGVPAGH